MYMPYRIIVVNIRFDNKAIYIGRPSALCNPYGIPGKTSKYDLIPTQSLDEACDRFKDYLDAAVANNDRVIIDELCRIHNVGKKYGSVKLGCFCKPAFRCHGDEIKAFMESNYDLLEELSNTGM